MTAKREKIKEHQLQGFKYFKAISGLLEELHNAGCQRDRAGNRKLHRKQDCLSSIFTNTTFSLRSSKGTTQPILHSRNAMGQNARM